MHDAMSGSPVARGCAESTLTVHDLARADADRHGQPDGMGVGELLGDPRQASPSLVCGSQRPQRIVLVHCRQPEDRAEPCRRDRLDGAAVALDGILQLVEGLVL